MTSKSELETILLNQIEIMSAISLLLHYAAPGLVGKAGELDLQQAELLKRYRVTKAVLLADGNR